MAQPLQYQQTPMSSKLTSMLILLREDCPDEPAQQTLDLGTSRVIEHPHTDGDTEDIILGGDVCNCRKSKCLKLYCQCFNAARVCNNLCRCVNCSNTDSNESGRSEAVKIILDRNPSAFDSKFLSRDLQAQQPAHKSGCKCRKSMCLKKYCECFEASLPCSSTCICIDCHNTPSDAALIASKRGESTEAISAATILTKANRFNRISGKLKIKQISQESVNKKNSQPVEVSAKPPKRIDFFALDIELPDNAVIASTQASQLGRLHSSAGTATGTNQSPIAITAASGASADREAGDGSVLVDAVCDKITSGMEHRGSELHSRPPLPQNKRHYPEMVAGSLFHPEKCLLSSVGTDGGGSFFTTRPTMLSRVVTLKKRDRHQLKSRHGDVCSAGSVQALQSRWICVTGNSSSNQGLVESQDSEQSPTDFASTGSSTVSMHFLSPVGAPLPVTSKAESDLKRFVSPNTANVASALSLLSRLPYCQSNH